MSIFGTPSTPAGQQTGFAFGSGFTPQTPATGSMFGGGSLFGSSPGFGASSGTGLFSNPTPAFGSPTPAFGSPTPAFGSPTPAFGSSAFGGATPAFGAPTPAPAFGNTTPAFGGSAFGTSPGFGTPTPASAFGASGFGSAPAFGLTPTFGGSPAFGTPSTAFGAVTPSSAFGASTPAFGGAFGNSATPFGTPSTAFGSPGFGTSPFGSYGQPQSSLFGQPATQTPLSQLTTQMAPVAPLAVPLPEREVQAICDAYKEDPANTRFAFKHLLLSVTEPSQRIKPPGASDIMWAEAMSKLENVESGERERLFPELLLGFKDLSRRLQLQDEAIGSDTKRLQATEANVKFLQRHFQVETFPWIQRLRLKEQQLRRKMLELMRRIETLEAKGLRMPLTRSDTQLGEKLRLLVRQLQPTSAELPRRSDSVLSVSRLQAGVGSVSLTGQLQEQSLADIQEVLRKQTEAISRLTSVLKRDVRDIEIMTDDGNQFLGIDIANKSEVNRDVFAMPSTHNSRYF